MERWEYMVLETSPTDRQSGYDQHLTTIAGESRWELVAVAVQFTTHYLYFKRRAS